MGGGLLLVGMSRGFAAVTLTLSDKDATPDLIGVGTYEVADYQIQALAGTPAGVYTLSFVPTADYSGGGPNYPTLSYASLGTFQVAVPEPGTLAVVGVSAVGMMMRRRMKR